MSPLIGPDQTFALTAVIMTMVALGLWAERYPWGQKLSAPLLLLAATMLLANTGVIPFAAPVYDAIAGFLVPMAIPLLLLRADFRSIVAGSGPVFIVFLFAVGGTVSGALVGAWAVELGAHEAGIVGTIASSYIGGSLNFVATAEALGIKDSEIYVAALSADAIGAVVYLLLLAALPTLRLVRSALPSRHIDADSGASVTHAAGPEAPAVQPFSLAGAVNGLALSLVICALSSAISELLGIQSAFILVVMALALLTANFAAPLVRRVSSEFELGTLFMYVFFAVIGAGANMGEVLGPALPILLFIVVMVLVHLFLLLTVGRLLRLDLAEVMVASNACILGPATAAALAASKGWRPLVVPGILVGMFGYAVATFIGVALAAVLGR